MQICDHSAQAPYLFSVKQAFMHQMIHNCETTTVSFRFILNVLDTYKMPDEQPTSTPPGKQNERRSLYLSGNCFSGG